MNVDQTIQQWKRLGYNDVRVMNYHSKKVLPKSITQNLYCSVLKTYHTCIESQTLYENQQQQQLQVVEYNKGLTAYAYDAIEVSLINPRQHDAMHV
jgi:hypothetical protein